MIIWCECGHSQEDHDHEDPYRRDCVVETCGCIHFKAADRFRERSWAEPPQ
jgi:hypothetical protein